MGIVILTTETSHHAFFVRELSRYARIDWVLLETEARYPPFETAHEYEVKRESYEREKWFEGQAKTVGDFAEVWRIVCANEELVHQRLRATAPEAVFVFGTGKLLQATVAAGGMNVLNLHGGDPLGYRGLDSHLWAIYHRDFSSICTTLHRVSPELDCGDIVELSPIPIRRDMQLHELRSANAEMCVRLCRRALELIGGNDRLSARPQEARGRYYSHMPAMLKSICIDRFARHTRSLP